MSDTNSNAMWLADILSKADVRSLAWCEDAADELRRLSAIEAERDALRAEVERLRAAPAPVAQKIQIKENVTPAAFESWWQKQGQFLEAGGGDYEKIFAWHGWNATGRSSLHSAAFLTTEEIIDATHKIDLSEPGWVVKLARAVERACAEAWGVKLVEATGQEGTA